MYSAFCRIRFLRIARFYLIIFFLLFIIFRTGCALIALCLKAFAIPVAYANIELLAFYLSLPGQDPEWVRYVWDDLVNNTRPEDLRRKVAHFISIEQACSTRTQIQSLVGVLSARNGYPVPQDCIDLSVMKIIGRYDCEFDRRKSFRISCHTQDRVSIFSRSMAI